MKTSFRTTISLFRENKTERVTLSTCLQLYCTQKPNKMRYISFFCEQELSNLARTSNILWNRAIDFKQQSQEREDMVKTLRRGNKTIQKDLNVLRQQHSALKQGIPFKLLV